MRRIYESNAVERDESPFTPGHRDVEPESFRSIPATSVSRLVLPDWLRYRAISIGVEAGRAHATVGERLPFAVTLGNSMPFPVTIPTVSAPLWTWRIDGHECARTFDRSERTDEARAFTLARGERKRFVRGWDGRFRVSESEWEPAPGGTYELGVAVNVESPARWGLTDETTIEIREG